MFEEKINQELKAAMLAKDEAATRGLRAIKAAIIVAKTEKGASGELTDDAAMKMLQKLVKQRKESVEIYLQQNRADLAKGEQEEIAVLEKYLPKQLDEAQVRAELATLIAQSGASSAADMGKVMGMASKHFAGKADNRMVSALVKEMLSA
jgi:uncharacterized protein YqeY